MAELDQAKTTFFSNVSHELRTPLTLILGPLEQFLAARPDHDGLLVTAQRNATRLRRLVNDLLDFSRIEAGKLNLSLEPVDLGRATADVASLYRSTIEAAASEAAGARPADPTPARGGVLTRASDSCHRALTGVAQAGQATLNGIAAAGTGSDNTSAQAADVDTAKKAVADAQNTQASKKLAVDNAIAD